MSAKVTIQLEGWEEIERKLQQLGEKINAKQAIEDALQEGAETVRAAISAAAPVRTGQLAGSIEVSSGDRVAHSLRIGPSKHGFYGRYLEYGTSKMAARPFIRPTFDAVQEQAQQQVHEALWRAIEAANQS